MAIYLKLEYEKGKNRYTGWSSIRLGLPETSDVLVEAVDIASGVYLIRAQQGDTIATQRVVDPVMVNREIRGKREMAYTIPFRAFRAFSGTVIPPRRIV